MSRAKSKTTPLKARAPASKPEPTTLRPRYEVELDASKAFDILEAMEDTASRCRQSTRFALSLTA